MATKIKAERVTSGVLWLKTNDPSLAQNLSFYRKQIINKYNQLLGLGIIKSVRIGTGEIDETAYCREKEEKKFIKEKYEGLDPESLNEINDPELKGAFSHFFRYHTFLRERRLMNGCQECPVCGRLYEKNGSCYCQKIKY